MIDDIYGNQKLDCYEISYSQKKLCSLLAGSGVLSCLKWVKKRGCVWDEQTVRHAVKAGHLEVLKWCHKKRCPWYVKACEEAASGGHLQILEWIKEEVYSFYYIKGPMACALAARKGHMEILQWLRQN